MALHEEELVIEGFHCTSCAQAVERALSLRAGVAPVQATFSTETLRIAFDPTQLGVDDIQRAIREVGFTAYTQDEAAKLRVSPQERDLRRRLARTRLGWALRALVLPFAVAGRIPPQLAALSMSVSSLLVVGNALRLRRLRLPAGRGTEV